jgi:deoxycytidylate deaminase
MRWSLQQPRTVAMVRATSRKSDQPKGRSKKPAAPTPIAPSTEMSASALDAPTKKGPELVFGLVGAVGAQLTQAAAALADALKEVDYGSILINVLDTIGDQPEWHLKETHAADEEMNARMDCGNACRKILERNDALALFAIAAIQDKRKTATGFAEQPLPRTSFILRSLKTPQEIDCLRKAYGDSCYIVAVYCPHEIRKQNLAKKIADSYHAERSHYLGQAEELIERDMREPGEGYGQNLRDSFPEADVFLDGTSSDALNKSTQRFIEIIFGHPFRTPTREEVGMFQAYGAKLRSAQAGRQVGAAITRDGDVVCIGTNEVAKAFGGQYWEGDEHDGRDHRRSDDSTQAMTRSLFADLLARLRSKGWLAPDKAELALRDLLEAAKEQEVLRKMKVDGDAPPSLAEKASILDLIEFMRAVHAEMAALMSAARHGTRLEGCHLFCTAFPCHECARHIVAAGIKRVYFIEPYPKSRVAELFDDSIVIDAEDESRVPFRAFTGVAPRLYTTAFIAPERRDGQGRWLQWDTVKRESVPRRSESLLGPRETEWLLILYETLRAKGIATQKGKANV